MAAWLPGHRTEDLLHLRRRRLPRRQLGGELVDAHDLGVPGLLVGGHGHLERAAAVEALVEGRGAQLGVAEGVGDALGRDRVPGVAGVAHQRPARPEGPAEEVGDSPAVEPLLPSRRPAPARELRRLLQRREEVAFDVGLVRRGLGLGPADDDHGQPVVGRRRPPSPVRPGDGLEAAGRHPAEVGVVAPQQLRLLVVLLRPHRLGHQRVATVGADHHPGPLHHRRPAVAVAADAHHRAVLHEHLLDGEALPHLGAGGDGRVDQDLVEDRSAGGHRQSTAPSTGWGVPAMVKGPKSTE